MNAVSKYISVSLLVLPPLLLTIGLFIRFPAPTTVPIYPSLQSLPPSSRSWKIFPDTYYDGGAYVTFPNGKVCHVFAFIYTQNKRVGGVRTYVSWFQVRYWLIGPEKGQRVNQFEYLSVSFLIRGL